jgi:hypothetical protein
MNDLERGDVRQLLDALKRAEWADIRKDSVNCPVCHRPQAWGHVCSCPIKIALVKIGPRLLGTLPLPEPDALAAIVTRLRDASDSTREIAHMMGGRSETPTLGDLAADAIEALQRRDDARNR